MLFRANEINFSVEVSFEVWPERSTSQHGRLLCSKLEQVFQLSVQSITTSVHLLGTLSMTTPSTRRGRQFFQLISVAK